MREALDKFEEGLSSTERVVVRNKSRTAGECLLSPFCALSSFHHFDLFFLRDSCL